MPFDTRAFVPSYKAGAFKFPITLVNVKRYFALADWRANARVKHGSIIIYTTYELLNSRCYGLARCAICSELIAPRSIIHRRRRNVKPSENPASGRASTLQRTRKKVQRGQPEVVLSQEARARALAIEMRDVGASHLVSLHFPAFRP